MTSFYGLYITKGCEGVEVDAERLRRVQGRADPKVRLPYCTLDYLTSVRNLKLRLGKVLLRGRTYPILALVAPRTGERLDLGPQDNDKVPLVL